MDAKDRVQELAAHLRTGDFASLRNALAPVFFDSAPHSYEPSASDRIADLALEVKAAMPDLTASLADIGAAPDGSVTASLTLQGTHTGDLWGVPGDGAPFTWTAPVTFRSVDDRLAFTFNDLATPDRVGVLRGLRLVNPPDEMDLPPHFPVKIPEFILKLAFTGKAGDQPCSHLDQIAVIDPPADVCQQCVDSGDIWPALRMCLICGFVGCCDTAKHRHMAKHYEETGHPIFRSIRADEGWIWCYADDAFFERTTLERYRK